MMSGRKRLTRRNVDATEEEEERREEVVPEEEVDNKDEEMNKLLAEAGFEAGGLSNDEKKQICEDPDLDPERQPFVPQREHHYLYQQYEMLQVSKAQYEREEEMRKMANDFDGTNEKIPGTAGLAKEGERQTENVKSPAVNPNLVSEDAVEDEDENIGKNESFAPVLQLSVDSIDDGNDEDRQHDIETSDTSLSECGDKKGGLVTVIDDEAMDETDIEETKKSQKSQRSQASKTIVKDESMDLTCLSNNSGKHRHREHNITDFESKSMNETNLVTANATTSKVGDRTEIGEVPMEETHCEEEIKIEDSEDEEPLPKKARRKCMLLHPENDDGDSSKSDSSVEMLNVSLQCSLPRPENSEKSPEEDRNDDSDDSVIFSGQSTVVEESALHTPSKKRISLGSNDESVIPETQEQNMSSPSLGSPGGSPIIDVVEDPYVGETLDPTGDDVYKMETEDMSPNPSPNVFSPIRPQKQVQNVEELEEMVMTDHTRDEEDELAAADAVLEQEEIDDHVPLIPAQPEFNNDVGNDFETLDFGCNYKMKTLSDKEVQSIIDNLRKQKPKEFDVYDPPQNSDDEAEDANSKKSPSSPPVPSLVNKRRLKRHLYDPCPMYAPPGVNVNNFALRISKYWEDYAKALRAAQERCHVCLPWGEPVKEGDHVKNTLDVAAGKSGSPLDVAFGNVSDDDIEITTLSRREKRLAERDKKKEAVFMSKFNTSGKLRKEQQNSKTVDDILPDIPGTPPDVTSSPKLTFSPPQSDSDDEFEVTAPVRKRIKTSGRGRGRGKRGGKTKKGPPPMYNIMEYYSHSQLSDEDESAEITRAAKSAREELFGGAEDFSGTKQRRGLSSKSKTSKKEDNVNVTQNKDGDDDDDDDNNEILANLSGQATFQDDRISISSSSNRTTPAEGMLNPEIAEKQTDPKEGDDNEENGFNSLDDLETEIPADPLENLEEDVRKYIGVDEMRPSAASSSDETQDPRTDTPKVTPQKEIKDIPEDSPVFPSSPNRDDELEKSMVKLSTGKLDYPRVTPRKRKPRIPPYSEDGYVNEVVKVGYKIMPMPSKKRGKSESDSKDFSGSVFDFDNDIDIPLHLQWSRGKTMKTYTKKKKDIQHDEEPGDEEPTSMVTCPLCNREFAQSEVEQHAATCLGDDSDAGPPVAGPSRARTQTPSKRKRDSESDDDDLEVVANPSKGLRRPPIRKKAREDQEKPKRGRGRRKKQVIEDEDSDVEEQPSFPKEKEPTEACIICNADIPRSQYEYHVVHCLEETDKARSKSNEEKRTTRAKRK